MDYEYAAGIMDADGCFGIKPKKRDDGTYSIRIYCKIDQKLKTYFLQELADEYSVTLYMQSNGVSRVTLHGGDTKHFGERIRPHALIKGKIIDYILSLRGKVVNKEDLAIIRKEIKDLRDDNTIHTLGLTDRYFAGYIDGDGWLASSQNKSTGQIQFKIGVLSHVSQRQAIDLLVTKYGGNLYYRNKNTNIGWNLYVTTKNIEALLPVAKYLRQKKERFDFIHSVVTEGANLKCNGATGESNAILHSYFKSINCGQDT